MTTAPRNLDRYDHHVRMARIYLHEASRTIHRDWAITLLAWAGERRRRAMQLSPAPQIGQIDLFSGEQ